MRQHIVDVRAAGGGVREVEVPVRVRGPDDPVAAPGDHEQHTAAGAQDQPGGRIDPVAGHHQVDALGNPDGQLAAAAGHGLDVVGPHSRRVDGLARPDIDLPTVLEVVDTYSGDPFTLPQQPRHPGAGGDQGAVVGGGAGDEHGVPRVVDLGIPVLDRAHQGVRPQGWRGAQRGLPGQVAVVRYVAAAATQGVVEQHPTADVGALPHPMSDREHEGGRAYEVRAQGREQKGPFPQRLGDQRHIALLEVPQPAVDELAGPAGCAGREIPRLDQGYRQPAGGRVERHPRPGDAAADDDDVEDLGLHLAQGVVPGGGVQPGRSNHRLPRFRRVAAR